MKIQQRPLLTNPDLFQGLPSFMQTILAGRGVKHPTQLELKLKHLLKPTFKGLDNAVTLINEAIDTQQQIVIVGDYDTDGATSTALMVLALGQMGAKVNYVVPDRFKYGYGLTPKIADLVQHKYHPQLLITVDNGISSHAGVEQAQQHGMKVIITDHHLTTKTAPEADAVVNPNQLGCPFESKALAGVGVAFYILAHLATQRKKQGKTTCNIGQYLDLVALGTYADVAALDYNNRILIDAGLKRIQQYECRAGILALFDVAGRSVQDATAQDFGFVLGPRLNAAGRMETMDVGIECLLAPNFEQAYPLAQQLQRLNLERRAVESEIKDEAVQILQNIHLDTPKSAIVLFEEHWHQGVIGIVAGRLKEQFHRPSIVFAPDEDGIHIKGSARSIEGIHVRDMIEKVAEEYPHLIRFFGGHAAAAGLTIKKTDFEEFKNAFEQCIAQVDKSILEEVLWTDGVLPAEALSLKTVEQIDALGPWGQKFPYPVFEGVFDVLNFRWLKEKHLKLSLKYQNGKIVDAICFNAKDQFLFDETQKRIRLVYQLDKNYFNGITRLQLHIVYLTAVI